VGVAGQRAAVRFLYKVGGSLDDSDGLVSGICDALHGLGDAVNGIFRVGEGFLGGDEMSLALSSAGVQSQCQGAMQPIATSCLGHSQVHPYRNLDQTIMGGG
jgi:hypothetical protein